MKMEQKSQMIFFFGAGAEVCFGMPSGAQYTLDTVLSKRSKMNEALKDFYKDKLSQSYSPYSADFLFTKTSHTFREIVKRACQRIDICTVDLDDESKQVAESSHYDEEDESAKRAFYKQVEKVQDYVFIDFDKPNDNNKRPRQLPEVKASNKFSSLMHKFSYYGSIEKDFSTIINPQEAGIRRFWRLINYFWSAFFSILLPVLDLSKKYDDTQEYIKNKYRYILNHLQEVIGDIYSDGYKEAIGETYEKSYYRKLNEAFPKSIAITTNYTPFLDFSDFAQKIYLAGKLSQFEIPEELRVVEFKQKQDIANKLIFPFLSTQAPVKPIIDRVQMQEYSDFMGTLDRSHILVIVGYGINEEDNHINALLRDFLTQSTDKKIIYCEYLDDKPFDRIRSINAVARKLRVSDAAAIRQIDVIPHYGKPEEIIEKLKELHRIHSANDIG